MMMIMMTIMMMMMMIMMIIMIIIAVTQSIFKLGPPDFAWKWMWKDDADGAKIIQSTLTFLAVLRPPFSYTDLPNLYPGSKQYSTKVI